MKLWWTQATVDLMQETKHRHAPATTHRSQLVLVQGFGFRQTQFAQQSPLNPVDPLEYGRGRVVEGSRRALDERQDLGFVQLKNFAKSKESP